MSCSSRGPVPSRCSPRVSGVRSINSARVLAAALLAATAAGCGHAPKYDYPGSAVPMAAVVQQPAQRDVIEDDGMPAQVPPRAGIRQVADDPREPWSRNYGSLPVVERSAIAPIPVHQGPVHQGSVNPIPAQQPFGHPPLGNQPVSVPAPGPVAGTPAASQPPTGWAARTS